MGCCNSKRDEVKSHYGEVGAEAASGSCCNTGNASIYNQDDLMNLPIEVLRASRGCADPHSFAALAEGESVLDLGSGGGIDAFIAAREVGSTGRVVGVDMTPEMISLANMAKEQIGLNNVEFVQGYIEDIPLPSGTFDAVISNCVINLSTNKPAVLAEAYRVLKDGGRFVVADMISIKDVDREKLDPAAHFFGCLSGVMFQDDYEHALNEVGFSDVEFVISTIFDTEMMYARAQRKGGDYPERLAAIDTEVVDGAIASVIIIARKR